VTKELLVHTVGVMVAYVEEEFVPSRSQRQAELAHCAGVDVPVEIASGTWTVTLRSLDR
jgi:hypothetical protein